MRVKDPPQGRHGRKQRLPGRRRPDTEDSRNEHGARRTTAISLRRSGRRDTL